MSFLASLALVSVLLPQGPSPQGGQDPAAKAPLLSPAERTSLRDKLAKYLVDDAAYSSAKGKARETAGRAREKSKEAFDEAWKKADAKGGLMASMADLRGIWENCFLLKQPSVTLGQLRPEKTKEHQHEYAYWLPKNYKSTTPMRAVWVLPGTGAGGGWAKGPDYFAATWDKAAATGDTIFHVPTPPSGLDLDAVPDLSRDAGLEEEQRRIEFMWESFSEVLTNHNIDRNRLYLDCGKGNSGFGLRFMTMFPDRFAGAILRAPSAVDGIRLGGLRGIPMLLLRTAATASVVDALQKQLDGVGVPTKVMDVSDEYPHKAHTADIEAWLADKKRNPLPTTVVIEPNHDKFNRAYWADIEVADSIVNVPVEKRARLECVVERGANRITVKATGVEKFTLFLNDDLVDLDKEFTVVVNEKAFTEKRTRSFKDLRERVLTRSDWEFLFPVAVTTAVPK